MNPTPEETSHRPSPIAGIHGILNYRYYKKTTDLAAVQKAIGVDWAGWLRSGLARIDLALPAPSELPVAYYSDCLKIGVQQGGDGPGFLDPDTQADFVDFVEQIMRAHAGDSAPVLLGRTGRPVRQASEWLTETFGPAAERAVTRLCRELRVYFAPAHAAQRRLARERLAKVIQAHRPQVLLAHSLGSVVAYETLCADPGLEVELLVTLGSPLGVRGVVFERLQPARSDGGSGLQEHAAGSTSPTRETRWRCRRAGSACCSTASIPIMKSRSIGLRPIVPGTICNAIL